MTRFRMFIDVYARSMSAANPHTVAMITVRILLALSGGSYFITDTHPLDAVLWSRADMYDEGSSSSEYTPTRTADTMVGGVEVGDGYAPPA